ncbi:LppP/LprE family lipoprotein [Corynebacterium falsenii]|uniref:LppP/LprE family lipoprotein n=1 Tax=Corynebacterium falsenii TaxID=108486 RepID=UPI0016000354|nr:LppP/LprE family lipoprotein [Corynebacterium falsenii]
MNKWVGQVPRHQPDWAWDTKWAMLDGYDDCAALSYIVITIEGATGSSPFQIMLFHNGQYLGTATKKAFGFGPTVTRESDSLISVIFHWARPGEGTANRSGESYAQFAWDDQQGKVVMTGDAPPGT